MNIGESLGQGSQECRVVYELLRIIEMCCLKKNSIESVGDAFEVLFYNINDFNSLTKSAADKLKGLLKLKEFKPDSTWVPISNLMNN